MSSTERTLSVSVWRGNAEGGGFEDFQVPERDNQTVLDVVTWIQQNLDPTLSYRFACRVGMCGSCAMTVNGKPRWTCRTHVSKVADADRRARDCAAAQPAGDQGPRRPTWTRSSTSGSRRKGAFHPTRTRARPDRVRSTRRQPERMKADAGIECINCAVCYRGMRHGHRRTTIILGPAALNRAWTLVNDARTASGQAHLDAVSGSGGCHNCHSQGSCTVFCPNELTPIASIAGLKRETAQVVLQEGKIARCSASQALHAAAA